MSGKRLPLSSNQNAANSPLRNSSALKQKRTVNHLHREEPYPQPPPAKKQVLEGGTQRPSKSPSQQPRVSKNHLAVHQRRNNSTYEGKLARERGGGHQTQSHHKAETAQVTYTASYTEEDVEEIRTWQKHHRERFPKWVFYFDKVPDDVAHNLKRQVAALGGREAAFFSIDITHVITTRQMPTEQSVKLTEESDTAEKKSQNHERGSEQEQTDTINPSLLTRFSEASVKRKLFDTETRARKLAGAQEQSTKQPKRNMDVLLRAKDMGKKIWSADKLQRMMRLLLENDLYRCAEIAYGVRRKTARAGHAESRPAEDRNLLRLLQNERVNGPSDRDPTVHAHDLHLFKGPYIYVYDIEEKQKPIMVREYPKVADKSLGEWPKFQSAAVGRCPFVEDSDTREAREHAKNKARAKAATEVKAAPETGAMAPPKSIIGKRTLGEMERGHTRHSSLASVDTPNPPKGMFGENGENRPKAFTGRAGTGRLFGGEPVASGVQPSNVTSAIRSQMVSSTATTPGVITGLSKEVHGLQRQVLKRNSTATSQDFSSRRTGEASFRDENSSKQSFTLGRTSSRKLETVDDGAKRTQKGVESRKERPVSTKSKQDMKPGYCENCAEKYADFDEHIESRKHRKFADDDENWLELDDLISRLERMPKHKSFSSWTAKSAKPVC
ncbi:Dfp1/Him1, central region-domain-containing protein [Xylariomycetidae sp. FL0641]|nr:Dfp1/Him1, central region-domain-containing protein [Xylariomycetidae sp. FL0641]